jgi:hypothetical protein
MAKRITLLLLAMWFGVSIMGQSCCNAGGLSACGSTGLLTGLRNNSAGMRLMMVPFETNTTGENSYQDNFYVAELAVRYQVAKRLKLCLQQPFRMNHRRQPGEDELLNGLADTRLTGSYAVFDNKPAAHNSLIYWELGAGLKLPTGKYDPSIYYRDLPGNLNLGMGNLGYLFQSNFIFFHRKMGVAHQASFQLNGKSRDDYHFGDQFTSALTLFREIALGETTKLTPMAGATVELFGKNYLPSGNFAEGSGGHGWLAMVGLNARFGQWQVGATSSMPFSQNYSGGAIVAKQRYSLELTKFF